MIWLAIKARARYQKVFSEPLLVHLIEDLELDRSLIMQMIYRIAACDKGLSSYPTYENLFKLLDGNPKLEPDFRFLFEKLLNATDSGQPGKIKLTFAIYGILRFCSLTRVELSQALFLFLAPTGSGLRGDDLNAFCQAQPNFSPASSYSRNVELDCASFVNHVYQMPKLLCGIEGLQQILRGAFPKTLFWVGKSFKASHLTVDFFSLVKLENPMSLMAESKPLEETAFTDGNWTRHPNF